MSLSPLASLLNPHPCALVSDLFDSAIRTSGCSQHVACDNGSVTVDLHVKVPDLYVEPKTCIDSGLEAIPLLFKRIELLNGCRKGDGMFFGHFSHI